MPSRFQAMKCAAAILDELSDIAGLRRCGCAFSWPMRWNTRSAPDRSTRTAMPGNNFVSNALAIFSASVRSVEV